MAANFGLYYPFIHFKDDKWLKLSAVYFDKMYRIVPSGYKTEDSDTVRVLADFVDYVRPEWARPQFGETFAEFIAQYDSQLVERYGVANCDRWDTKPEELMPPTAGGPSGIDPRLSYVYFEKMTPQLRDIFLNSGLARFDPGDERWMGMHPMLAQVYVTALADQLAGERQLQPMTDETLHHLAISGLSPERLAQLLLTDVKLVDKRPTEREIEQAFAFLALETVLPKNIAAVPAEKIAKVRERLAGERGKFQEAAVAFAQKNALLREISDQRALQDHLKSEIDKTIRPELDKLKDALRSNGIDVVMGAMNMKVELPALATTGLAALGLTAAGVAINPIAAGVAGVVLLVAKVLRDRRKGRQKELSGSSVSYLFRIDEALSPGALAQWVSGDAVKHGVAQ
jgi:Family of unknown function (DUF6236)